MSQRCAFQKANGGTCGAFAMKDSTLCFFHRSEPEIKHKALVAQRKGGLAQVIVIGDGVKSLDWPKQVHLRRPRDVRRFVSRVLNELRAGQVEPQLANSIFVGCQVLLKSFDGELSDRTKVTAISDKENDTIRRLVAASLKPPTTQ